MPDAVEASGLTSWVVRWRGVALGVVGGPVGAVDRQWSQTWKLATATAAAAASPRMSFFMVCVFLVVGEPW